MYEEAAGQEEEGQPTVVGGSEVPALFHEVQDLCSDSPPLTLSPMACGPLCICLWLGSFFIT